MASIGTFGRRAEDVDPPSVIREEDSFEYFGTVIRLRSREHVPVLAMMEFARIIHTPTPERSIIALSVVHGVIEGCVFPEDWELFRQTSFVNDSGDDHFQDLVTLSFALYGSWAARPFPQPSDSSRGEQPAKTEESSGNSSSISPPASPQRTVSTPRRKPARRSAPAASTPS